MACTAEAPRENPSDVVSVEVKVRRVEVERHRIGGGHGHVRRPVSELVRHDDGRFPPGADGATYVPRGGGTHREVVVDRAQSGADPAGAPAGGGAKLSPRTSTSSRPALATETTAGSAAKEATTPSSAATLPGSGIRTSTSGTFSSAMTMPAPAASRTRLPSATVNASGIDLRACRLRSVFPTWAICLTARARRLRVRRSFGSRRAVTACSLSAVAFSSRWRSFACCRPRPVEAVTCARSAAVRHAGEAKVEPAGTAAQSGERTRERTLAACDGGDLHETADEQAGCGS